jgi:hypothetical protein
MQICGIILALVTLSVAVSFETQMSNQGRRLPFAQMGGA